METQTKQKEKREQVYARLSAQYRAKWTREAMIAQWWDGKDHTEKQQLTDKYFFPFIHHILTDEQIQEMFDMEVGTRVEKTQTRTDSMITVSYTI